MSEQSYENDFDPENTGKEKEYDDEYDEEIDEEESDEEGDEEPELYELTDLEALALREEVEKEEESLLEKLQKIVKRERKEMRDMQRGMRETIADAAKRDLVANEFKENYDIGKKIIYRKVDKGVIRPALGTIFGYDKAGVKVYEKDGSEHFVQYESIVNLVDEEVRKKEEVYYDSEGKVVDWKTLDGEELAEFVRQQEKRDLEIRESKKNKRPIVLKTDKKYPHQIYLRGFDPINPFVKGFDIGREIYFTNGDTKVKGKVVDYNKNSVVVSVKGEEFTIQNENIPGKVEINYERSNSPSISENAILDSRIDEKIPGYERYDIYGDVKKILLAKWQKLLSKILPQDKQIFVRDEKFTFPELGDEELYRTGDEFENWVIMNKKDVLDKLYFEMHGIPLFNGTIVDEKGKMFSVVNALENYQKTKLVEVFLKTKKEFDEFYNDSANFIGGELGMEGAIRAKEKFDEDVSNTLKSLGENLFKHRYAEFIYSSLVNARYEKETPEEKRSEADFQDWVLYNKNFISATIKDINTQFVKEAILTIYKVRLEKLATRPKTFDDRVTEVLLSFVRWFYRRTIGLIDKNSRYKQYRETRDSTGYAKDEIPLMITWGKLDREFSSEEKVFPLSDQWWIRDLELLMQKCSEDVHTIRDFLRKAMFYMVLLQPPFSQVPKGIANYFYEKVASKAFRIKHFPVPLDEILPNLFYSENFGEQEAELLKKVIQVYIDDEIRGLLFDLPYFKFSRLSKINIVHQAILKKFSGYTKSVQEQCALDTNTGVQPMKNHMNKGWHSGKSLEQSNLEYMKSGDIVLCIYKGKFYCHSEKALVNQFLKGDYTDYQTGRKFAKDYVEAILAPYENMKPDDQVPEIGVAGTFSLEEVKRNFGPGKYTLDYNMLGLQKIIIKVKDEDSLRLASLRLPPIPKIIWLKGLDKKLESYARDLFRERLLGKIEFVVQEKDLTPPKNPTRLKLYRGEKKAKIQEESTLQVPLPKDFVSQKDAISQKKIFQRLEREREEKPALTEKPKQQEKMSDKRAEARAKDVLRVLPKDFQGSEKRYLDIGTGNGQIPEAVSQALKIDRALIVTTDIYEKKMPYETGRDLWLESGVRGYKNLRGSELDYVMTVNGQFETHPLVRFDLITIMMVLHHVEALIPFLETIVKKLAPGGFLVIREHDIDSYDPKQKNLVSYVDDYHKKWPDYTASSFMKLFPKEFLIDTLLKMGLKKFRMIDPNQRDDQRRYVISFTKPYGKNIVLKTLGGKPIRIEKDFFRREYLTPAKGSDSFQSRYNRRFQENSEKTREEFYKELVRQYSSFVKFDEDTREEILSSL